MLTISCTLGEFIAYAGQLFAAAPIESVQLTDRTPSVVTPTRIGGILCSASWQIDTGHDNPDHQLPSIIHKQLEQTNSFYTPTLWFRNKEHAEAALSTACVAAGKQLARELNR